MVTLSYSAHSDIGRTRRQNQDVWFANPELGLYGVSDGMGGHAAGGLASQIVAETLPRLIRRRCCDAGELNDEELRNAIALSIDELSAAVSTASRQRADLRGMGTTVVLALVRNRMAAIAHVGDSRAYLLRRGMLKQLTCDHTLAETLLRAGAISSEEAAGHPGRSKLMRYIGMQGSPHAEVTSVVLCGDDRLLLCSDRLFGMLDDYRICNILDSSTHPEVNCRKLIDAANDAGGQDNVTVLVLTANNSS